MTRSPRRLLIRLFAVAQIVGLTLAAFAVAEPTPSSATSPPTSTTPIEHVVIVLKENRSFDEYFGAFPNLGSYGTTTAKDSHGNTVNLTPTPDPTTNDIDHSPFAFNLSCHLNNSANPPTCRNDQFDLEKGAKQSDGTPLALSQMPASRIPDYWAWASKYALGAQFYASWKGASFGNNLFEVAGQSGAYDKGYTGSTCIPNTNAAAPGTEACHTDGRSVWALPIRPNGGKLSSWGCDDPSDTSVKMSLPPAAGKGFLKGVKSNMYPCYLFKSLPDVLTANGLTWGFYVDSDSRAQRHNGLDAINSIRNDPTQWANVKSASQFITDANAGNLPNVSWVLGKQTEHPPLTACAGENQSASYINAVMNGTDWGSTAIFVVWDEWGGFYDHMPPPQPDFVQYGFRVPFIAISPYTKAGISAGGGYIDTTQYSHASMLAFVLDNWSLPASSLTPAVQDATQGHDLMNMFDFSRTPNGTLLGNPSRSCTALTLAERRLYHRNPWD